MPEATRRRIRVFPDRAEAAQRREHTISAGDSLSAIAQGYRTGVDALVASNGLANRTVTLQVGQRLVVPR